MNSEPAIRQEEQSIETMMRMINPLRSQTCETLPHEDLDELSVSDMCV